MKLNETQIDSLFTCLINELKDNDHSIIQPLLNIDNNKKWLKKCIANAIILKDSDSHKSMMHLYCSGNNNLPREGIVLSVVKVGHYHSIQMDAQNCYLRSYNVEYRIRLEYKSFVFKKRNYNAMFKEDTNEKWK
ncbi:hypothetical protein RFI_27487 [Reticulomyxa filosa]|uniref:Uncharacterized protein n=1 Tax=Reticulomyxa filosa TaxID=46433 RepID=X6MA59_RETFI|nr:hypothetical protein RFI_27487 [Reticulomyxa filosa]|eukprot:ETO09890.1 hypothetical protein RFI_27487 [Reticulomyxa filosa]